MKKQNKRVVRLTESKLTQIVAESVRKVLNEQQLREEATNEMGLHNKKTGKVHKHSLGNCTPQDLEKDEWVWKYDGDRVDRHMWRMKKLAQEKGKCKPNGWPTADFVYDYLENNFRYLRRYFGIDENVTDDYTPKELYDILDHTIRRNESAKEEYYWKFSLDNPSGWC